MKDNRGHFYYPFVQNKRVRMYVRSGSEEIEFRLYNQEDPVLWESHGWVPHSAIVQAQELFHKEKKGSFEPRQAYDLSLAKEVLDD